MAKKTETPTDLSEVTDNGVLANWHRVVAAVDNFDGDEDQKFLRRLAYMSAAEKGGDHLNETILLKYWLVHEIQLMDKDGELIDCYRVVLITPDGKAYAFVSEVLARGIREIARHYGRVPLDPPMPVQVRQKNTASGNRCYVLVPVIS